MPPFPTTSSGIIAGRSPELLPGNVDEQARAAAAAAIERTRTELYALVPDGEADGAAFSAALTDVERALKQAYAAWCDASSRVRQA